MKNNTLNQLKNLTVIIVLSALIASCSQLEEKKIIAKAKEIHNKVFTIDSHTDTPLRFLNSEFDINKKNEAHETHSKVDFPRMKEGGLDAIFFAVFLGQGLRNDSAHAAIKERTLSIFEAVNEKVSGSTDVAEIALTVDDGYRIAQEGNRAVYIGIENGYPVGTDTSNIREFYNLGARYITLCHTKNNNICDSSTDTLEHSGLSDFGEDVVEKMNELGIMIDVSHISDSSFYDVMELSKAPIIASHSCARALCDHPRNLTDDMLEKLAENDGVIQICIVSEYLKHIEPDSNRIKARQVIREKYGSFKDLSEEEYQLAIRDWYQIDEDFPPELASVSDLVDHIDHVVEEVGIDHVGIGTDFDGGGALEDCYDVSQLGNITVELVRRGYTEEEIEKIWGGNFMRVFKKVEELASK
jgi:membrane dipeptidase